MRGTGGGWGGGARAVAAIWCDGKNLRLTRCNDMAPEDVEPACRLTLKNLQLEYLDLYLVHQVAALTKDAPSSLDKVTDEHRLGYSPESMAKTWEVSVDV